MRLALITPSLNIGGYEKVIIAYANELHRRSLDVDILCGTARGDLIDTISDGVHVYDFNARARKFLFPLVKYLKEKKPDILYCAFREYNCIGVIAKKIAGVNTCIYATQHGFQEESKFTARVKGKIIGNADQLIAVANGIADYEAEKLGLDRNRFIIFNNPVLDCRKTIQDEGHPWFKEVDEIPIIVMSGRIAGDKGEKWGIDILAEIQKTRTVRMIYLGDGPALSEVKQYAVDKGVSSFVDFLGFVENPMGYMKHCSLFLHTAIVEGFGNVIVEALYCNLPVCTTNCSGPMQIIENGKYGMNLGSVYDEGFVENAAKKISTVLDGKVQFQGLIERAMCFEVQSATDQFLSCYQEQ